MHLYDSKAWASIYRTADFNANIKSNAPLIYTSKDRNDRPVRHSKWRVSDHKEYPVKVRKIK